MASANSFLSEDELTCSICLEIFTQPVSLSCGHNFCKACIAKHWEDKDICQCPLCKEKFNKGFKLCVNTGYRDVVENFKKHRVRSKNDPGHNLERDVCKKHNMILEFVCRKDLTRVCFLCKDHQAHDLVPLKEEFEEKKAQLEQKKEEIQEMIQDRQQKIQVIQEEVDTKRKEKNEAIVNSLQVFHTLVASVERDVVGLVSAIEEKQKATERQAEMLVQELGEEITELKKRMVKLEQISHTNDHLQLIKRYQSFSSSSSSSPNLKNWSDVSINISSQRYVEDVKTATVRLEETLTKEMEQARPEFKACCGKMLAEKNNIENKDIDLETLPEGVKLDTIRQMYTVDMTFDPSTASDLLMFSEDLKHVKTSHIWWVNENPVKFNRYAYVLGKKGFSDGRFYFEVEAKMKTGWDLGIARQSVREKRAFTLNPRNGAWVIRMRNNKCTALNNVAVNISLVKKPERIGVFVDYKKKLLSFYDVDAGTLIYSFTDCMFNEKIYPFFSPGLPEGGINSSPLVLSSPPGFSPPPAQKPAKTTSSTGQTNFSLVRDLIILLIFFTCDFFNLSK